MKRMRVAGLLAGICVLFASAAIAATSFSWFGNTTTAAYEDSTPFPVNYTVLTYTSSDTNIYYNPATPFQETYGAGSDVFLQAMPNIILAGHYYTDYMAQGDNSLVNRYAYAVLIDLPYSNYTDLASIPIGTKWGLTTIAGPILQTDDPMNPRPPQAFDGGHVVLIPEPASAGLALFGVAVAIWRRRRGAGSS